ncbi:ribonuclease HII [Helicovermis profundi]|uniref:Ribonuclease HII n=1 Tax=Helicovermis profundi TaxID=3065157 RepID=A0AAU9E473_9FIRM|nr:ribonuclease HII [Clostridia bacterium S502]
MQIDKLSVKEIKKYIDNNDNFNNNKFIESLLKDTRKAVNKLGEKMLRDKNKMNLLIEKSEFMKSYERKYWDNNIIVGGIDEVGRGPLFGPVVSAVVILPPNYSLLGVDDSKKLTEKKREELYNIIIKDALDYSVGIVDNKIIDEINILNATKLSMKNAILKLKTKPKHLLIDALKLDDVNIPQTAIIKGDAKSVSIAAASIVAKVTRDRMIVELSKDYNNYDFENNKGYGTKKHYDGIKKHGITPYHRKTFLKNIL